VRKGQISESRKRDSTEKVQSNVTLPPEEGSFRIKEEAKRGEFRHKNQIEEETPDRAGQKKDRNQGILC